MADEKDTGPKMGHFVLKKGMRHSHVINGAFAEIIGDGVGTIELNVEQAEMFKDKIASQSKEAVDFEPAPEVYDEVADKEAMKAASEAGEAKAEPAKAETKPAAKP